jgi:hypothetical protein
MGYIRVADVVDNRQQFFQSSNSGPIVIHGFPALSQWYTLSFVGWSPLVLYLMQAYLRPTSCRWIGLPMDGEA